MLCNEFAGRATDYTERKLSIAGGLAARAHLATCRDCRALLRQMRLTVSVLRGLRTDAVPEATRASLLTAFRSWQAPSPVPVPVAVDVRPVGASARVLSALDRLLGGVKSLVALALLSLASLGLVAAVRPEPGAALPIAAGLMCAGMEMLAGLLPLGVVAALAWRSRRPSPWAAYAAPAGLGALLGQASLHVTCPEQGMYVHLAFHVAGVLAAIALGWVASFGQASWAGRAQLGGRA